jgi:potassium efflux system protein
MIRCLATIWLLSFAALHAQLPKLSKAPASQAEVAETPEQVRNRLQKSLTDARAQLARLENPEAESQLPEGISPTEYSERRRDVQQTISSLERQLKNRDTVVESETEAAKARQAREAWNGFKEAPPYSVLMVDDLRNRRDVAAEKKAASESTISLLEQSAEEARNQVEAAGANRRRAEEEAADQGNLAAKWRLESAKIREQMLATRVAGLATEIAIQRNLVAAATDSFSLLDLQVNKALPHQTFLKDDLAKIRKAAEDRQANFKKEIDAIDKKYKAALSARRKLEPPPSADGSEPVIDEITRMRLEAADKRVEVLQDSMNLLSQLSQLENQLLAAYEFRQTLMTSPDHDERADAFRSLKAVISGTLTPFSTYAGNQLKLVSAELREREARAAQLAGDDPRLESIADEREALSQKMAIIQRIVQNAELTTNLIRRWETDYDNEVRKQTWGERTSSFFRNVWRNVKQVWGAEVFTIDEKGVTLGRLLIALGLFVFGYLIAAKTTRRLQRVIVSRGRVGEAQAITLRRWLMFVIGFFLVTGTLRVMSIPLTVFAFFGGALAIGLGFGTQTLIKNFISGIIMLFERNIRVGDVVDVGGSVGTVTEINTRSSIIRSAEGLETLVPNSVFLENKITNWTHSNRRLRRTIRLAVPQGSPSQKVAEVLKDCASRHGKVLKDPEPIALFEDFGDTSSVFVLHFWVELAGNTNASVVSSDLRFMIEKGLKDIGVEARVPAAAPPKPSE